MKRTTTPARRFARALAPVTLAALALAACGSSSSESTSTSILVAPKITVTSVKGDPRSQLFAAIYARVLEDNGYRVSRKDPVELDRAGYLAALAEGEFQVIPDSTGALLSFAYSQPDAPVAPTTVVPDAPASTVAPVTTPTADTSGASTTAAAATSTTQAVAITNGRSVAEQLIAIRAVLDEAVTVGNPTQAEDKAVIACTQATVDKFEDAQFVTLTNLASNAPEIRLAGSAEWRDDTEAGLPALELYYGGEFKRIDTVEEADMAAAVDDDAADCFALGSMNPVITTKRLTILQDDKAMVRGNAWVPLMAATIANADVITALDSVNVALTSNRLNQMFNEIEQNGTDPAVVADAFLDTL
jgi:glycine betaine/choline ABC-type transport system substrate-binding protein